jgi:hypothetical protein
MTIENLRKKYQFYSIFVYERFIIITKDLNISTRNLSTKSFNDLFIILNKSIENKSNAKRARIAIV